MRKSKNKKKTKQNKKKETMLAVEIKICQMKIVKKNVYIETLLQ